MNPNGLCLLAALSSCWAAVGAEPIDVTAQGAKGDGTTPDTAAIQRAIDACAAAGGGQVVFPKGRYLSGSLQLRSGVRLVVTPEAVLLGSANLADYPSRRLILAEDATDVGIEGGGTIDGQGEAFWEQGQPYQGPPWRGTAQFAYRALPRPAFLHFRRCTNVTVRDITLTNSPSWTLHVQRCRNVLAERVRIRNPLYGPNTDGIDVNSCVDVAIRDCDIVTGDDGVVLKSTEPGHDHPLRNIEVSGCRIWSACNGLKLGTETHDHFENIVFRDCHLYSDTRLPQERSLSGVAIESVDGAEVTGVRVTNITMSNLRAPLFIRLGHRGGNSAATRQVEPRVPGRIRDVLIENVTAEHSLFESSITGIPGHPVEDVRLVNVTLEYEGGGPAEWVIDDVVDEEVIARYPEAQMFGRLPACGLYARHATGLSLSGVTVRTLADDSRPRLVAEDVRNLRVDRLSANSAPAHYPLLWLRTVQDAQIRNSAAPAGTRTFLAVEGTPEAARTVALEACDTHPAETPRQDLPPGGLVAADLPLFRESGPGVVTFEAEAMRLASPMTVLADPQAGGGACIGVPVGGGRDTGSARCRFEVSTAGDYTIWVRALAPSSEADSFYAAVDGADRSLSDVLSGKAWAWDRVRNRAGDRVQPEAVTTYRLSPGVHALSLRNRESGTRLDTVAIVRADVAFTPARDLP